MLPPFRRYLVLLPLLAFCGSARADDAARESAFRDSLLPLLRTYCFDCHDADSEIPLEKAESAAQLQGDRKTWLRALAQVRLGTMPTEDGETMDPATRDRLVKLIDELANAVRLCSQPQRRQGRIASSESGRISQHRA